MDKSICPMCGSECEVTKHKAYTIFCCKSDECPFEIMYPLPYEEALERFTTRPESAWKMFRRMVKVKTRKKFYLALVKKLSNHTERMEDYIDYAVFQLLGKPEQEAISIMQQIESELNHD